MARRHTAQKSCEHAKRSRLKRPPEVSNPRDLESGEEVLAIPVLAPCLTTISPVIHVTPRSETTHCPLAHASPT